jgi:hypothetical protein
MSRTLLLSLLLIVWMAGALAASDQPEPVRVEAAPVPADAAQVIAPTLSPMHQEIADLHERLTNEVKDLAARFTASSDLQQRLALQLRIDEAKRGMQLGSLEIQLRYAQAEGREDAATKLAEAIEQFKNPVVANAKPVERVRPTETTQH